MDLGGDSISQELYDWIEEHLPEGKTILELGSGNGTKALCEKWKVYSVEEKESYLNRASSTYIHAKLRRRWYDARVLKEHLPKAYDLLLIDGPKSPAIKPTRHNMLKHLDLFNLSVPIIVDDVHRPAERQLLDGLIEATGREAVIFTGEKDFGVL